MHLRSNAPSWKQTVIIVFGDIVSNFQSHPVYALYDQPLIRWTFTVVTPQSYWRMMNMRIIYDLCSSVMPITHGLYRLTRTSVVYLEMRYLAKAVVSFCRIVKYVMVTFLTRCCKPVYKICVKHIKNIFVRLKLFKFK